MLPNQLRNAIGIIALLFGVVGLFAADQNDTRISFDRDMATDNDFTIAPEASTPDICTYLKEVLPMEPVSIHEEMAMEYLRENEKFARDFYLEMFDIWNDEIFSKMAEAEEVHMETVLCLLEKYEIKDPAAGLKIGEFKNQEMAELFPRLIERGSKSLADAFAAGSMLEVWNLCDLMNCEKCLNSADLNAVVTEFKRSTRNHIRVMHANLKGYGKHLEPCSLDHDLFELITHSGQEKESMFYDKIKDCPFFRDRVPCDKNKLKVIN